MGTKLLVFGGGRVGEGVSTPDLHRDGAILDLTTRRWRGIAPAPFPVLAPAGVWSGQQVVVIGGVPNCSDAGTGCPTSSLRAAVYTVATNRWRTVELPRRYGEPNRWFPTALHWTGSEALFSLDGADGIAIDPADHGVRAVSLPGSAQSAGQCDTGSRFVSIGLRTVDTHAQLEPAVLDRNGHRTATGPSFVVPEPQSFWSVACTRNTVLVASGDATVIATFDLTARRWSSIDPPPGATRCALGSPDAPPCPLYRLTGHGHSAAFWLPGKARAVRYDTSTNQWADIAPGPGIDTSTEITWVGDLGVTTRFDPGTGADTGELVVWRPA